jgi:hypothetical protein
LKILKCMLNLWYLVSKLNPCPQASLFIVLVWEPNFTLSTAQDIVLYNILSKSQDSLAIIVTRLSATVCSGRLGDETDY